MNDFKPDFENVLAVLNREVPSRPVLYEFLVDPTVVLPGCTVPPDEDRDAGLDLYMKTFMQNGYDFFALPCWVTNFMSFPKGSHAEGESHSLNEGVMIRSEQELETYAWPDADAGEYHILNDVAAQLPAGAKLACMTPGGVYETIVDLLGYENMCYMLLDNRELVKRVADEVGMRVLRYVERHLECPGIGLVVSCDDWGHKTGTQVSPADLRELVFPWHKRIVDACHAADRCAVLHSCGLMEEVWDDIIDDMGYDGKHSYEDTIQPVEECYDRFADRIAILGGIDVDFLCRATPDEVYTRSCAMLERANGKGGYALGSGNSIARYVPTESCQAMRRAARGW